MTTVKTIDVAVVSTVDKYESGMKKAGTLTDAFNKDLQGLTDGFAGHIPVVGQFSNVLGALGPVAAGAGAAFAAAGAGIGLAVAGFTEAKAVILPALDRLEDAALTADRLGILTAELQKLHYAAEAAANVGAEQFNTALDKMSKAISSADVGNKKAIATFQQLGLNIKELARLSPDEAFLRIADAMSQVQSPMDQVRLTMEIFGKSGADLVNVLREGSSGIEAFGERAEELRLVMSEVDAENVKAAKDAIDDLELAFQGLGNTLAVFVAPTLAQILKDLTDIIALQPGNQLGNWLGDLSHGMAVGNAAGGLAGIAVGVAAAGANIVQEASQRAAAAPKPADSAAGKLNPGEIQRGIEAAEALAAQQEKIRQAQERETEQAIENEERARLAMYAELDRVQREEERKRQQAARELDRERVNHQMDLARSAQRFREAQDRERKKRSEEIVDQLRADLERQKVGIASAASVAPAALDRGSQEAFSAFNQANKNVKMAEQQLTVQKKMERHLEELKRRGVVLQEAKL